MLGYSDAVPFKIKPEIEEYQKGIYQIKGLISYHKKTIVLEYKLSRANWGSTASNVNWVYELREENQHHEKSSADTGTNDSKGTPESGSGIIKSEITLSGLREVKLKINLLGCRVWLIANSLSVFENLHGAMNEKLVLQIHRKEKSNMRSMISKIQADLSEEKLNRLANE